MGFAASQIKFLTLTSSLLDAQNERLSIANRRLELADKMDQVADDFNNAMTNQVMVASVYNMDSGKIDEVTVTYDVITKDALHGGLGMNIVTPSGLLVVPDENERAKIIEQYKSEGIQLSEADFSIMKEVRDPSILQKNIEEGNFSLTYGKSETTHDWDRKDQAINTSMVYDLTDDAAAKATYDTEMRKVTNLDTKLEKRDTDLEIKCTSYEKQMEACEKVIDDNIDKTYNTFA